MAVQVAAVLGGKATILANADGGAVTPAVASFLGPGLGFGLTLTLTLTLAVPLTLTLTLSLTLTDQVTPVLVGAEHGRQEIENHFEGYISELRVWNRALSSDEAAQVCLGLGLGLGLA